MIRREARPSVVYVGWPVGIYAPLSVIVLARAIEAGWLGLSVTPY